jgi:E3 ubiquitin-protein ligase NEDD4
MSNSVTTKTVRLTVIAADGLVKKDLFFKLPDPFGKSRK